MSLPLAAEQQRETVSAFGRPSRSAIWFAIGYAVAAILTASATTFALSGAGVTGPASPAVMGVLAAALVLCLVLSFILTHRIRKIARASNAAQTGGKLHLRFVTLFSLAAVAPAVIVAAFMGLTFSRTVEGWFDQRVRTMTESASAVGAAYVQRATDDLTGEVFAMAEDLNRARAGLIADRTRYGAFLAAQAERRGLASAYVVDSRLDALARAEGDTAPAFVAPPARAITEANTGNVWMLIDRPLSTLRALYRLDQYNDAYLYVTSPLDPTIMATLINFEASTVDYNEAQARQAQLRVVFTLSYLATAWLVLLGAVWVGLENASRISEPVGRLANAARRVASGDLKVRVAAGPERDEMDALATAFNSMTAQLDTQRRDLLTAQDDAIHRSQFIETVLGGVSAGVVGIDRDGRITAANRSAAQLLGQGDDALVGRRLIDVAPECADLLNQPAPSSETPPQRVDLMRDGQSLNLSVRMTPDTEGGLVLTFDDMTKLISAQRQEAWKDVARRIAHEIKNPLTPIQLSAERLQRKYHGEITSDPDTFQKCTDTILRQVADIGRMVDEFSSFARMPTPRMAFADMSDVVRSTAFGQRLAFADVRIEVEGADAPIGLVCDERLIAQSLLNLIKNAAESVQARRARDGEPKDGFVLVRLRDLDFGVQFEVCDNGLGFPAQNRHRLIEPYVTTRVKGAGLGLAIVARIIEDHGGLIELDDGPGPHPGAIVRFVLPKRGEEPTDIAAEQREGIS
ncbi:nitrogen regulation protein NtrY [alpha proteobacterium U9-1i]|nr:nitrogen regulation protein NtrY [alpha proteobacterium U9-1i]